MWRNFFSPTSYPGLSLPAHLVFILLFFILSMKTKMNRKEASAPRAPAHHENKDPSAPRISSPSQCQRPLVAEAVVVEPDIAMATRIPVHLSGQSTGPARFSTFDPLKGTIPAEQGGGKGSSMFDLGFMFIMVGKWHQFSRSFTRACGGKRHVAPSRITSINIFQGSFYDLSRAEWRGDIHVQSWNLWGGARYVV